MSTKCKFWLFVALFMLMGMVRARAQGPTGVTVPTYHYMNLELQHVESDFVPSEECNYYRHFLTLENETGEMSVNVLTIQGGDNQFILYRYPAIDGAIPTAVAELIFTVAEAGVDYEITYLNQEPLEGYDLELVTEGTLAVEDYMVNLEDIVLVDQCKVELVDNGEYDDYYYGDAPNFDFSKLYFWTSCGYVMQLATDEYFGTNSVEVPRAYGINLFTMGNYTYSEITEDIDAKLRPGMKNACFDCFSLDVQDPAVTGYTILRGDNEYPTDTISYVVRTDNNTFIEQSNALPEYFGQEETWQISRNDTSKYVIGTYDDYMTYVPVTRVNGEDRVNHDGENTYGYLASKTGVAGLDAWVNGEVFDQDSDDPCMWKDENGQDCAVFNPYFIVSATLPDYATWEYEPEMVRIWVKCDNIRYCNWEDGEIVNDVETPRENLTLIYQEHIDPYYWDEELGEYVYGFYGLMDIGDPESEICPFGATYSNQNNSFVFLIRFYYEAQTNMPLKAGASWMPTYCVVEKEITWNLNPDFTGVKEVGSEIEVGKTYYNVQGMASDKPFSGVNIVVTRYSDGSTKTSKMIK